MLQRRPYTVEVCVLHTAEAHKMANGHFAGMLDPRLRNRMHHSLAYGLRQRASELTAPSDDALNRLSDDLKGCS
jgi:hypothetical protein